jgi:hypothetical protein
MIPNVIYRRQNVAEATSCSASPKIHWASKKSAFLAALQESATGVYSDPNESCPHPIYLESIVKIYKCTSRRISINILHPGFQIKILYAFLFSSTQAKRMPPPFILLSLNNVIIFHESSNYEAPYFLKPPLFPPSHVQIFSLTPFSQYATFIKLINSFIVNVICSVTMQ